MPQPRRATSSSHRAQPAPSLGVAPAEFVKSVLRQTEQALAAAGGNVRRAVGAALTQLEHQQLIDAAERAKLGRLFDLVAAADRRGRSSVTTLQKLLRLHDELMLTPTSPTAASIAASVLHVHESHGERSGSVGIRLGANPQFGFLGAVVVGGVIGGLAGGPAGVLIGVVGGAAGAMSRCLND